MKKAALFVSGLLLTALVSTPAMAEVVRIRVTARVVEVNDPGTMLHGKITVGSRLTGTYVYNTNTPNSSDDPEYSGLYVPYANEARMRFVSGGVVFESNQPTQGITIQVNPQVMWSQGQFEMTSLDNKTLPSTAQVDEIRVRFDGYGNVTQSVALPSVVPDLQDYNQREVFISSSFGQSFYLYANIESVEAVVPDAIQISPAAGSFLSGQHFDAGLTLPRNSNIVNVIAKANGVTLPIGYPGTCSLVPQNGPTGQPSVLCPNAQSLLGPAAGAPIDWTVELSNGTILTESAAWTLQQ